MFPELKDVSIGKIEKYALTDSAKIEWLVLYNLDKGIKETDKAKIYKWLNQRLNVESIFLVQNNDNE